jgi:hypothetical protein
MIDFTTEAIFNYIFSYCKDCNPSWNKKQCDLCNLYGLKKMLLFIYMGNDPEVALKKARSHPNNHSIEENGIPTNLCRAFRN